MSTSAGSPDPTGPGNGRTPTTVWLANALLGDGAMVDIEIVGGAIARRAPIGSAPAAAEVVDLSGRLLLPALVEPHAHLDKALTADRVANPAGDLMGAIEGWISAAQAGEFSPADTEARAGRAMESLLLSGVTRVRTHVNVGDHDAIASVQAVRRAGDAFNGLLDVEIVALTAAPMTGSGGAANRSALLAAVESGVDLIGGCPHLDTDAGAMIDDVLAIATDAGLGVDLHVDETLETEVLTLETLAQRVLASGFAFPVTASHCVSLGMQLPQVQARVASLVAEAGITVVTLPQTNLFLQGRDVSHAVPRGLTALAALADAGATVVAGGDNVEDPFNLMGRSDPLETAALLVMAGHVSPDTALSMVTSAPGDTEPRYQTGFVPEVGTQADLVAIDAPSVRGAIATASPDRLVFRRGVLVAESRVQRRIVR
jgi:cytosine deaminase